MSCTHFCKHAHTYRVLHIWVCCTCMQTYVSYVCERGEWEHKKYRIASPSWTNPSMSSGQARTKLKWLRISTRAMRFYQLCVFEIETRRRTPPMPSRTVRMYSMCICIRSHKRRTKQIQLSQNTLNWIQLVADAVTAVGVVVSPTCVSECWTLLWLVSLCPLKCARERSFVVRTRFVCLYARCVCSNFGCVFVSTVHMAMCYYFHRPVPVLNKQFRE